MSAPIALLQHSICDGFREEIIRRIESNNYDIVFLAARWEQYSDSVADEIFNAITFAAENSKHVSVLSQVPLFEINIGDCYVRGKRLPLSNGCDANMYYTTLPVVADSNQQMNTLVESIPNATFLDLTDQLCKGSICSPFIGQTPAYFDDDHLNIFGSAALAKRFLSSLSGTSFSDFLRQSLQANDQRSGEN